MAPSAMHPHMTFISALMNDHSLSAAPRLKTDNIMSGNFPKVPHGYATGMDAGFRAICNGKQSHGSEYQPANSDSRPTKKARSAEKLENLGDENGISLEQYKVGWVCALPLEMAAARGMLDQVHPNFSRQPSRPQQLYFRPGSGSQQAVHRREPMILDWATS
ncbi:hypothetical protein BDP55DRAFT_102237 [Colletotrichum godetiae]|uniref:Uncharacterized protein n=1 Tax=Colletotrichum godetiae TaxID=1209918 RepID=A0AAJ0ASA9_9PEZI|nr:uncharacterized protein BDP55DRAFT_102237 [Colletotrichum godetiae]KAK1676876.1 hypothetical protein BDP55DRAFT_102237 [Colletotrichum godetiae]